MSDSATEQTQRTLISKLNWTNRRLIQEIKMLNLILDEFPLPQRLIAEDKVRKKKQKWQMK